VLIVNYVYQYISYCIVCGFKYPQGDFRSALASCFEPRARETNTMRISVSRSYHSTGALLSDNQSCLCRTVKPQTPATQGIHLQFIFFYEYRHMWEGLFPACRVHRAGESPSFHCGLASTSIRYLEILLFCHKFLINRAVFSRQVIWLD
jgi:hypothetical protein